MDLGKIGITYEGAYDSERLYEPLSVVAHSNGGVYMSIAEVAEVDPASDATKWAVMIPPGTMTTSMISQEDVDDTKKVPSSSLFNSVIRNLKNLIAEKIAKTSITNTNVNDANKVPSAALLYSLNSNLTTKDVEITNISMTELFVEKTGNVVSISGWTTWKNTGIMEVELFSLPQNCRPKYRTRSFVSTVSSGGAPKDGFSIFDIETSGKCNLRYMSCDGYPIIDCTFVCG